MKKSIYILGICALSLMQTGCDNYDDLIPQEYNTILSLKNSGEQDVVLYRTGEDTELEVTAMKTGSEPGNEAHASMTAMSNDYFERYMQSTGKKYKRLPDECFTIADGSMDYGTADGWKTAKVTVHFEKAARLVEAEPGNYVIPILLTSETDSVLSTKRELLFKMTGVVTPKLSFAGNSSFEISKGGGAIEIPLNLQITNQWDFTAKVTLDGEETTLQGITLGNDGRIKFTPGSNGTLTVNVPPFTSTALEGNIALRMEGVEGIEFDVQEDTHKISVAMERYPLTEDMLSTNAQEPTEGPIANILDNDPNTFFHSAWSVSVSDMHYVQVTLPEGTKTFSFGYQNRVPNANAAICELKVYGGSNEEDLEEIRYFSYADLPWNIPAGIFESPTLNLERPVKVLRFYNYDQEYANQHYFVWSEFWMRILE